MVRPQRDRGPTVLERKAAEEAVAAKAEEEKRAARARKDAVCGDGPRRSSVAGAVSMSPVGACLLGRGRAARNAPLSTEGSCVSTLQQRKQSLAEAAEFRSLRDISAVSPAGAGRLDEMPEREDFPDGSGGEEQWRAAMDEFVENNFTCKGIELRSADQHELKAGFFGEWHRRNGQKIRVYSLYV